MKQGHGRVDYPLYVEKSVVGVIEARHIPTGDPPRWETATHGSAA
jgi:hypothetical protein